MRSAAAPMARALALAMLPGALLGCGLFASNADDDDASAGRRPLVLGPREAIDPNPGLADVPVTLPPPVVNGSWPQSGRRASKSSGHLAALRRGNVAWTIEIGEGASRRRPLPGPPIHAADRVFALDSEQTIYAVSPGRGEILWTHTMTGLAAEDDVAVGGGLAYGEGRLIAASGFGYVAALDPKTGERLWTLETGVPMTGSATVLDGRVYVGSYNNDLFVIDINDGEILWLDQTISEPARVLASPSPAVSDNLLVVPFSSGELIAYLPANGRRLWVETLSLAGRFSPISTINDIGARPVIADGIVYATSQSGLLAAIDSRTGRRVWSREFPAVRPPVIAGRFLFAVSTKGELVCLDRNEGDVFWVRQLPRFANEEKKKDRLVWSTPLLVSGRVLMISSQGDLLSLSVQDGSDIGALALERPVTLDPIGAEGRLFVHADDGTLTALE